MTYSGIFDEVNSKDEIKKLKKENNKLKKDYEKQGYKFMSRENIYKSVVKILNNKFSK